MVIDFRVTAMLAMEINNDDIVTTNITRLSGVHISESVSSFGSTCFSLLSHIYTCVKQFNDRFIYKYYNVFNVCVLKNILLNYKLCIDLEMSNTFQQVTATIKKLLSIFFWTGNIYFVQTKCCHVYWVHLLWSM